jgi:asparagine synthetase B (glutamine-hydrolysing)
MPGHSLKWVGGNVEINLVRNLDVVVDDVQYIRNDVKALNLLAESLEAVVGDYTGQIENNGQGLINQLSGGVDSSLTQFFINSCSNKRPLKSISYVIQVPAFNYEIEYAQQASQLMHTDHTFVQYTPQDYPGLLTRSIDIMGQPPNHETTPSLLAIAEFVRTANWAEKYFFTGHAADSLFGFSEAMKLKGLEIIRKIPLAATWLRGMGMALSPITSRSQTLLKGAEIIASGDNPDAIVSRSNSILTYEVDWNIVRRSFGDQAVREALTYRRNFAAENSHSSHYLDKVHLLELVTFTYDLAVRNSQLALGHRMLQVFPFHDEDLIKLALTFHPDMRYIKGFRYKHLLRRMLEQRINAPVAHKSKGVSTVNEDMVSWMKSGPLKPLVENIQRPSFLDKADFERMIKTSNYFLLALLTYDIFTKRVIKP